MENLVRAARVLDMAKVDIANIQLTNIARILWQLEENMQPHPILWDVFSMSFHATLFVRATRR